ncbi:helix-turn-helix domain-containing protein [Streptomyces sp. HB2AG]|uniref:helix-turn-helix domain-containing protein n=1 Tax=Streptomyces sp. HB2AG TaxID=2983400 RepID=UPI0022A9FF3E|nr:helix-turn-helix transcriptional regulator [Streptomyces sp. HB2AG]MCZ2524313.1 helix-turn-helix transcriptional regulator [Streptomyces sp. HB2AG]
MADRPVEDENSARAALAGTLRYLRERTGKSLGQLAEDTRYDKSYLYRLEAGERLSKSPVMEDLDAYYGSDGLLVRLWKLARMEMYKDKYKAFMRYEASATIMHKYMQVIPGLLQTEAYARTVLSMWPDQSGGDELERQVTARIERQELLRRTPSPNVRVILDESVLRCPAPDPKVWADQLLHLVESASRPSITLQVLPMAAGVHPLRGGSLSVMWQADGSAVAYAEGNAFGELVEDPSEVAKLRLSYDLVRDMALPPSDSLAFVERILEENRS